MGAYRRFWFESQEPSSPMDPHLMRGFYKGFVGGGELRDPRNFA